MAYDERLGMERGEAMDIPGGTEHWKCSTWLKGELLIT